MEPHLDVASLATQLGARATKLGAALATAAEKNRLRQGLLRWVNVIVGVSLVLIVLVPDIGAAVGESGRQIATLAAAGVLFIDTLIPVLTQQLDPERLTDYSRYILSYEGRILEAIADTATSDADRRARLLELIRLTRTNVTDVESRWPRIAAKAGGFSLTAGDLKTVSGIPAPLSSALQSSNKDGSESESTGGDSGQITGDSGGASTEPDSSPGGAASSESSS